MKRVLIILSCIAAALVLNYTPTFVALAQNNTNGWVFVTATPSGACNRGQARVLMPAGTIYTCQTGTWATVGGTTSLAFSAITAGTNAAALVIGSGGSLSTSGTGTIAATSVGGVPITGLQQTAPISF